MVLCVTVMVMYVYERSKYDLGVYVENCWWKDTSLENASSVNVVSKGL